MKKLERYRNFAIILVCMSVTSSVPAFCQTATAESGKAVESVQSDLNADAGVDAEAMTKYESAVRGLLYGAKFEELERLAAADRDGKAKFAGGVWKLYVLYQGLKQPVGGRGAQDDAWEKHLNALTEWAGTNRESVTARVALSEALMNYVEKLRNEADNRRMDQVKSGGDPWRKIRDIQHMKDLVLKEASTLKPKCPHLYFVMLESQEMRDRDEARLSFEQAIAFEPTYFPYYRLHALYQRAEWDGDDGGAEKYADDMSKRIGGKPGAAVYFEIAAALNCSPSTRRMKIAALPWDRIREGYAALEELYGPSLYKMNQFAYLAIRYDQLATAAQMLERIGERGDAFTWSSTTYFEYVRAWAIASPEITDLRNKSNANAATPEGHKYQDQIHDEVGVKFRPTIQRCMGPLAKGPAKGWDLFLRIGGNGEIEEVKSWPKTQFTDCVVPDLKGSLSAPPAKSSYWVSISAAPFLGWE